MNSPCYHCDKRSRACHDTCDGYKEWKAVDLDLKDKIRNDNKWGSIAAEITAEGVRKARGGKRK